jgi:hypothetical protein
MTTYNLTDGTPSGFPAGHTTPYTIAERVIDWSATSGAEVVNSGSGTVQNDVIQIFQIPAGTWVQGVYYKVVTASSNLADLDIGDGSDTDGYHDGIDATSTGAGFSFLGAALTEGTPNTFTGYIEGKYYSAADTIDLLQNTNATITTGRIKFSVVMLNLNPTK